MSHSRNWDSPKRVCLCPSPRNQRGGHTRRGVRGVGSPNSDDRRKSIALCLYSAVIIIIMWGMSSPSMSAVEAGMVVFPSLLYWAWFLLGSLLHTFPHHHTLDFLGLFRHFFFLVCPRNVTIQSWTRIFRRLWSSWIDSKEWIPPAYLVWRAGTITLFLLGS